MIQVLLLVNGREVSNLPIYFSEAGSDSYMTKDFKDFKKGINEEAQDCCQ